MSRSPSRRADDALTISFTDSLDAAGARGARELLASSARDPVVLDFTRVRHVDWHALALLAQALADQPPNRVTLRGLCDHHLKVLRYLDVRLAPGADALVPSPGAARAEPAARA